MLSLSKALVVHPLGVSRINVHETLIIYVSVSIYLWREFEFLTRRLRGKNWPRFVQSELDAGVSEFFDCKTVNIFLFLIFQ